jgi:hypothetical protein
MRPATMGEMTKQFWQRRRGLPVEAWEAWRQNQSDASVLAWARSSTGFCVAGPATFAYGDGLTFTHVGWHQIERGGWNVETRRLSWTLYPGAGERRHGFAELREPGRLPEVFRERVAASLVLEQFVPLQPGDTRGVVVAARRDLGVPAAPLTWHSTLTRGVSWQTPGVAELAEEAVARLRAEWDTP